MSSDCVIRIERVSKRYTIGLAKGRSNGEGFRHILQDAVTAPWRALRRLRQPKRSGGGDDSPNQNGKEFYALSDVTFDVNCGEVLGIIGRNGAGKSTLLKILSRITEPTNGRIGIKGRVASLLEVGTGFHPELTGRENIYLNGAILGMKRTEIARKFDEIVDFAGVEEFLETPVKRYSSGMYVRLAFAVAAHLEPEILVIDEVLAVGDSEFQKKCLGKMKDVASSSGRTVIFVSHTMSAIRQLCHRALLLSGGRVSWCGDVEGGIQRYLGSYTTHNPMDVLRGGSGDARFTEFSTLKESYKPNEPKTFQCAYRFRDAGFMRNQVFVTLEILDVEEIIVARIDSRLSGVFLNSREGKVTVVLKSPWLKPGMYRIRASLDSGNGGFDSWDGAAIFTVECKWWAVDIVSPYAYCTANVLSDCEITVCESSGIEEFSGVQYSRKKLLNADLQI